MRKTKNVFLWGALVGFALLSAPAAAKVYVAEPLLVQQPPYAGMTFYVYRPYGMPKGWYMTFDGYPVFKNKDGVWVYGAYHGPNLVPTHYVVGSVIPSMAGLTPYATPAQISSFTVWQPPVRSLPEEPYTAVRQPQIKHQSRAADLPIYPTYTPEWLFDRHFMAVGKWKGSVDRLGVLHRLGTPVAWKGNSPNVLYVWTGEMWYSIMAREGQRPAGVLKENLYFLTRRTKRNGFVWYEADVPLLAQQAAVWGYYWMGEVMPR
ncbi:MAG: hypothetical protein LBC93_01685 [Synergistaceae bacterium]|nr:hypothetical protein [Synergistaceae bacterium]